MPYQTDGYPPFTRTALSRYTKGMKVKNETTMTLAEFTELVYVAYDEGRERDVVFLANDYPDLYEQYCVAEGLFD